MVLLEDPFTFCDESGQMPEETKLSEQCIPLVSQDENSDMKLFFARNAFSYKLIGCERKRKGSCLHIRVVIP